MITGGQLYIIEFISGVPGAETFNFFFSLICAGGLLAFVPVAIASLLKKI